MFNTYESNEAYAERQREEKVQYWTDQFMALVWKADDLIAQAVEALSEVEDMARSADRGGAFNSDFQSVLETVLKLATDQRNAVEIASQADNIDHELGDWQIS